MANLMLRQRVAETVNLVAIRNMNAQEGVTSTGFGFEVVAHRTSFFECVQNYVSDSLKQVLLLLIPPRCQQLLERCRTRHNADVQGGHSLLFECLCAISRLEDIIYHANGPVRKMELPR